MRISDDDPPTTAHTIMVARRQLPALLGAVRPGWHRLLQDLHDKLVGIYSYYQAEDVKEKFGGLRVYLSHYDDRLQELVNEAEEESFRICEQCGEPGSLRTSGRSWILTLCDACDQGGGRGPISDH